ncbi:MAG: hypothetical protein IKW08_06280 [Roseburia sp.]|nr:hypothetical protein [Roseburia sp.]
MKMKQKKYWGVVLLLLGSLMLSGCGMQEAPYDLSEEEQQLIVSYSAHVVSKFNSHQKDGLTYVPESDEPVLESTEIEVIPESETEQEENTEIVNSEAEEANPNTEVETTTEEPAEETTIDSVFADTGLTFTYLGNEVTASYMEDDTYAVNAGLGKSLLVVKLKAENLTEEAITIDNMASGDVYSAKYVMESGKLYNAKSVMTLLINDFTTYEGTIEPQNAVEMVIVFEIPADTTVIDEFELNIERNDNFFRINL